MWSVQSMALRRFSPQPQRCAAGYQQWPSSALRSGESRMSWVRLIGESSEVTITTNFLHSALVAGDLFPVEAIAGRRTGYRFRRFSSGQLQPVVAPQFMHL
jgi:hypothetical protein